MAGRGAADGAESRPEAKDGAGEGRRGPDAERDEKEEEGEEEGEEGSLAAVFNSRASAFISRSRAREEAVRMIRMKGGVRLKWARVDCVKDVAGLDLCRWILGGSAGVSQSERISPPCLSVRPRGCLHLLPRLLSIETNKEAKDRTNLPGRPGIDTYLSVWGVLIFFAFE